MPTPFQSQRQSVEDFCLPARSQQPEQLAPLPSPVRLSSLHAVAHTCSGLTGMIPRPETTPLRLGLLGLLMAAIAVIGAEPSNASAPAPFAPVSPEAPRAMARRPMPKAEWLDSDRDAPNGTQYKTFQSKVLGREVSYLVYLPPGYGQGKQRYPAIYWLHGMGGNQRGGAMMFVPHVASAIIARRRDDVRSACRVRHQGRGVAAGHRRAGQWHGEKLLLRLERRPVPDGERHHQGLDSARGRNPSHDCRARGPGDRGIFDGRLWRGAPGVQVS